MNSRQSIRICHAVTLQTPLSGLGQSLAVQLNVGTEDEDEDEGEHGRGCNPNVVSLNGPMVGAGNGCFRDVINKEEQRAIRSGSGRKSRLKDQRETERIRNPATTSIMTAAKPEVHKH